MRSPASTAATCGELRSAKEVTLFKLHRTGLVCIELGE
jgi:hypothetical protein